jgi:phage/plasmid-associated DNA primase
MELVEEYEENLEGLEIFRGLIKVLCNNDDLVRDYLEAWIAQMIQFPAIKSICPTLISNQGAGKGTLMALLAAMIGETKYFETTEPSRDVWGHFNGRMADSFLINLDELSRKESMECEGKIKGLITNPRLTINEKGVKPYPVTNYSRYFATTNKDEPWKITIDDRRHFIIRSSDELIGNKIFFDKCYDMLKDVNIVKTCFEYFKNIPGMKDFGKIKMPETEFSKDTKEASVCPIEKWLEDFTKDNYYGDTVELLGKKQYELFSEWCKKCGLEYKVSSIQFGLRLKRLKITGIEMGKHTNKGATNIFKIIQLKKYFKLENIVMDTSEDSQLDEE